MAERIPKFHGELLELLPRLRTYAYALTRDRDQADDLVQNTVMQALARRKMFKPGSNLAAWTFRIQRNLFIDSYRRRRPTEELDPDRMEGLSCRANQDDVILKNEFLKGFAQLPAIQREALVLSAIEGMSYDDIASQAGVAVGTIKSRVCRARDRLMQLMMGEELPAEPTAPSTRKRRFTAWDQVSPSATPEA
jgi:RNA polymerase sigma-70 factor (ECF subfamily)